MPIELPVVRVEPSRGWVALRVSELWEYRELLYFFTWRDIKVRYRQTVLGGLWAVLQPFFGMVVFSVFFGRLAGVPSDGVPYPVFAYAALVPWTFFANGLTQAANSLVNGAGLLQKVYFPRLLMPAASIVAGVVDFVIALAMLSVLMWYFGLAPRLQVLWVPAFFLLAFVSCLAVALWLSALNVEYRDVRHAVPFLVQMWLFSTPIAYPSSLLSEPWRTIYGLNPMAGVVEGFRWALLGTGTSPGAMVAVSSLASVALLVGGAFYFRRMEKKFADIV